ncbi:MAG: radical SAM protein [Nanoarchaeota archaeon]|nr:radical SAM protein [Nanoarchaeota archaeon]
MVKKIDIALVTCMPDGIHAPPIGLAYLAEYLKSKKFKVKVFDTNIWAYHESNEKEKSIWSPEHIFQMGNPEYLQKLLKRFGHLLSIYTKKIIDTKTKIIGFSVNPSNITFATHMARLIKEKNKYAKIIFGGPYITSQYKHLHVSPKICDYYVLYEGEESTYRLVNDIQNKKTINIPGVVINKKIIKTPANPKPMFLDKIPYPKYKDFDISLYKDKYISILTSKGCINNCAFCGDYIISPYFRHKKPERIVEELSFLNNEYGIKMFHFVDLLCNGNLKKLEKMCDLIIKKDLKIEWDSYAVIRTDMSSGLFKKMKKSGCSTISFGVDSGSDNVLKLMRKKYSADEATKILTKSRKAGIITLINIITGFPGETKKNHEETIEFLKKNKNNIQRLSNVSTCFLMPTSSINKEHEKFGIKRINEVFWKGPHNNTHKIRNKRAYEIVNICENLGMPVEVRNINTDTEPSIYKILFNKFRGLIRIIVSLCF